MPNDFTGELFNSITDSIVDLGERVGELERKETLGAGDGIGPFKYELNVDVNGRGDFTSIGAACAYIAAQPSAGIEQWVVWIHPGSYTEDAFEVPDLVTLEGLGGDVFISTGEFFHEGSFITAGAFVTMRNLQCTQGLSSATEEAFVVDAGEGLRLENCKFRTGFQGPGFGDVFATGCVRETGGSVDFFGCDFSTEATTDAQWFVVLIDATDSSGINNIRSCRIHLDPGGPYSVNGDSLRFEGSGKSLYLLETTILPRLISDPGFDITIGIGATVYLRATNYNKADGGPPVYIYSADEGTVSSVDVEVPDILTSTGGPITTSGTITIGLAEQEPNLFFASPDGVTGEPTFRAIEIDDIPELPPSKITGDVVTGTSVAGRITVWDDTSTVDGYEALRWDNTDLGLIVGRAPSVTAAYLGFPLNDDCTVVQIGQDNQVVTNDSYGVLQFTHAQQLDDRVIGSIFWVNREILANEKRVAAIEVYRGSTVDSGYTVFYAMSGGALAEAGRITQTGALQWAGDVQVGGSIFGTLSALRTSTSAGNTLTLQAYDVDGASYTTFATLTANNTPTMDLAASVTKDGSSIIVGSGSANQVAYFTGADAIGGDAGLTYDPATDALAVAGSFTVRTTALVVTTGDRVGIRTAITPLQPFDVVGTMQSRQYGSAPSIRVSRGNGSEASPTRAVAGNTIGQIAFLGFEDGTDTFAAGADFVGVATGDATSASNVPTELNIRTNAGAGLVTRVTVGGSNATVAVTGTLWAEETTGGLFTLARNDTGVAINDSIGKINFWGNDTQLTTQFFFGNIEVQAQANIGTDAAFGKMLFRTTGNGAATAPVERLALGCVKNLTDAATNLFDVTLNAGEMAGGAIVWTIIASNGTDHQSYSGIATYAVVNKAGTYTTQITHNTANDSKAVSSGTLTAAWTVLNGTNKVTIRVTPTGSLTETIYQILYSVHSNSPQSITIL